MNYNNIIFLIAICFALNLAAMKQYPLAQNNYQLGSFWDNDGQDPNQIIPLYCSNNQSIQNELIHRRINVLQRFLHTHGIDDVTFWDSFNQMRNQYEKDWRLQYHKISHNLFSPTGFQDMVIKELERCGISSSRISLQYSPTLKDRFFNVISPAFSIDHQGRRITHPGLIQFSFPLFKQIYHPNNGAEFLRAITLYAISQLKSETTIITQALKIVFYKNNKQLDTHSLCCLQRELHNIAILNAASKDPIMAEYFNKYFSWSSHNTFSQADTELLIRIVNDTPMTPVNDNRFLNDIFNEYH